MTIEPKPKLLRHLTREPQGVRALAAKLKSAGVERVTDRKVREWYDEQVRGGHAEWSEKSIDGAIYSAMHVYSLPVPAERVAMREAVRARNAAIESGDPEAIERAEAVLLEARRARYGGDE